jgi:hypothetical protein
MMQLLLSSKLWKVTDASATALAAKCGALANLKLSRSATDASLAALANSSSCSLRVLDMHASPGVTAGGVEMLLAGRCGGRLREVLLPPALQLRREPGRALSRTAEHLSVRLLACRRTPGSQL